MALYDPVNGVYRKVSKKYDPVDGVYRKVKAAYDPVDGVYRQYFGGELPPNTIVPGTYKGGSVYYSQYYVDETYATGDDIFDFALDHTLTFNKTGKTYTCSGMRLICDTGWLSSHATDGSSEEIADYWGDYFSDVTIIISTAQTVDQHFYELFMTAFTLIG